MINERKFLAVDWSQCDKAVAYWRAQKQKGVLSYCKAGFVKFHISTLFLVWRWTPQERNGKSLIEKEMWRLDPLRSSSTIWLKCIQISKSLLLMKKMTQSAIRKWDSVKMIRVAHMVKRMGNKIARLWYAIDVCFHLFTVSMLYRFFQHSDPLHYYSPMFNGRLSSY